MGDHEQMRSALDELRALVTEQTKEVEALRAETADLRQQLARQAQGAAVPGRLEVSQGRSISRGTLLKAAAAGAAGIAAAGTFARPQAAMASDGSAIIAGQSNTTTAGTALIPAAAQTPPFLLTADNTNGGATPGWNAIGAVRGVGYRFRDTEP